MRGKLAVVGASGVLGAKLVEQALAHTDMVICAFSHGSSPSIQAAASPRVTWQPLDLADAGDVRDKLDGASPDVVVNTAAMTNVDACEQYREGALAANARGPGYLTEACVRLGARLIHVSTDYVFPGDEAQPGPYREDALPRPVNYYGWTKLEGERAVAAAGRGRTSYLIVRTALVYGHIPQGRTNFVKWLVAELKAGRRVKVAHDQINTPTVADDLALALLHVAQSGSEGLMHIAGPDRLSRYEWATIIAAECRLDEGLLDVTSTAQLNQPAKRPLQSGLRSLRADEWNSVSFRGVREGLRSLELS